MCLGFALLRVGTIPHRQLSLKEDSRTSLSRSRRFPIVMSPQLNPAFLGRSLASCGIFSLLYLLLLLCAECSSLLSFSTFLAVCGSTMLLLSDLFVCFFILSHLVRTQEDAATIIPASTEQGPVVGIETAPIPAATEPHCLQRRDPSDPPSADISQALDADESVAKACNVESQSTGTIGQLFVISYALHAYLFNISHNTNVVSRPVARPNQCPDAFNSILEQCVTGAADFWGGYTHVGIANYSSKVVLVGLNLYLRLTLVSASHKSGVPRECSRPAA